MKVFSVQSLLDVAMRASWIDSPSWSMAAAVAAKRSSTERVWMNTLVPPSAMSSVGALIRISGSWLWWWSRMPWVCQTISLGAYCRK